MPVAAMRAWNGQSGSERGVRSAACGVRRAACSTAETEELGGDTHGPAVGDRLGRVHLGVWCVVRGRGWGWVVGGVRMVRGYAPVSR